MCTPSIYVSASSIPSTYLSSYWYICVLMLVYMYAQTRYYVSICRLHTRRTHTLTRTHTLSHLYTHTTILVLILVDMRADTCAGLILDAHALADTEASGNGSDKGALLVILYSISLLGPSSLLYVAPYALYTPIYLASSYCCVCVGIRLYV